MARAVYVFGGRLVTKVKAEQNEAKAKAKAKAEIKSGKGKGVSVEEEKAIKSKATPKPGKGKGKGDDVEVLSVLPKRWTRLRRIVKVEREGKKVARARRPVVVKNQAKAIPD